MSLEDIITGLTKEEKEAMIILGRHCMSKNKVFREETLQKKLPPAFKDLSARGLLKDLARKGLVGRYRPRQWRMTSDGFKVAQYLWNQRKRDTYHGFSFK